MNASRIPDGAAVPAPAPPLRRRIAQGLLRLLAFCLLSAAVPSAASDRFQGAFDESLRRLGERRGEAAGLSALLEAQDWLPLVGNPAPFVAMVEEVAKDPETHEGLRANALNILVRYEMSRGDVEAAEAIRGKLSYLEDWLVIGPFPDENKGGYDKAYPPEIDLKLEAEYDGKGHPVSWRAVPELPGREVVPLGSLLDPAENVAGYALTFVHLPAHEDAVLRGGFNEAFKIWVNGESVAERRVYNGRAFDQYAFPCRMRKGWNLVLVKVCNRLSAWNFTLRLTRPSGMPLDGWRATSDFGEVDDSLKKIFKKRGTPSEKLCFMDPEAELRAAAEAGAPGALADLAVYYRYKRLFDRSDRRDIRALERAIEADPQRDDLRILLSRAHEDHNLARRTLEDLLDRNPNNVRALFGMARYYQQRGMPLKALDYIESGVEADPGNPALLALQAQLRMRYVSDAISYHTLDVLFRRFPDCEAVYRALVQAAHSLDQDVRIRELKRGYLDTHRHEPDAWIEVLRTEQRRGRDEEAWVLFDAFRERFPFYLAPIADGARRALLLNRPERAARIFEPILEWAPDWAVGRRLYGDVLLALGDLKGGIEEYRLSLMLMPQQEELKRKVAYLSPEEEGFESTHRVGSEEIPDDVSAFVGEQVVTLLDNTVIQVQPSGLSSRYHQRVVQVLEAAAAESLQSFPITYDPDQEEIRILEASVLKADGYRVHAETFVSDLLSQPRIRMYYRARNLVLNFPTLEAGDRVWIEYKVSDIGEQNDYGRYFGLLFPFGESGPVVQKQLTLILPDSLPVHVHQERLDTFPIQFSRGGEKIYRWIRRGQPKLNAEPGMPPFMEVVPYIHVSTFEDWGAMGAWYASFIQDQWEMPPELKEVVEGLVAGLETDEERVKAIHRWVVQQTRYVALEFGVHGFRPYKVHQVFERKFGDCKDKALLLNAMLEEAGVEACMALVRTRSLGEIAPEPASLAVFNHAICYVPSLDLFLDGTAEYSGVRELPRSDEGVWTLLVWKDGRSERKRTPDPDSESNRYVASYTAEIPREGLDAPFTARLQFHGIECAWIRRRYQDPDKRAELLEKDLSGSFPGTRISGVEAADLAEINRPVALELEGQLGGLVQPDGTDAISLPVWLGRLGLSRTLASLSERRWPLLNDYVWKQQYVVNYLLPDGARPEPLPPLEVITPFGSIRRDMEETDGGLRISTEVTMTRLRIPIDEYPAFREFCERADAVAARRVRVILPPGAGLVEEGAP